MFKDHVETQPKPAVSPTNVLVEMQPGNIVVYKFIDEASGRLIQQIPSEQMLNLSTTDESPKERSKKKKAQDMATSDILNALSSSAWVQGRESMSLRRSTS